MTNDVMTIEVEGKYRDNVSSGLKSSGQAADRFEKKIEKLGKSTDKLGKKKINPTLDVLDKATAKINKAEKSKTKFSKSKAKAKLEVEDKATEKIKGVEKAGESLGKQRYKPKTDLDDKAREKIKDTDKTGENFGKQRYKPKTDTEDKATPKLKKILALGKTYAGKTFKAVIAVDDKATNVIKKVGKLGIKGVSKVKSSVFSLKTAVAGVLTGVAAKKAVADPMGLSDSFKTYEIGFSTMLKSAKKGKKFLNDAVNFANVTPFDTEDVVSNAQSMMANGWKTKDILKDLTTMGNASAALGSGAEGIKSMTKAFGQMKTGGVLHSEEMNQLTEAGVNAWKYLSEAEGVSVAKLREMVADGAISGDKAVKSILKGMKEFDGMMDKTSKSTVSGLLSNIKDTFETGPLLKWGQGLQKGAIKGLSKMQSWLEKNEDKLSSLGDSLEELGEKISTKFASKLSGGMDKLSDLLDDDKFKNGSIGGKLNIAWDEMIAQPFGDWWESTGKPGIVNKFKEVGSELGKSVKNWLKESLPGGENAGGAGSWLLGLLGITAGTKLLKNGIKLFDWFKGGNEKLPGGSDNPLSGLGLSSMAVAAETVYVNGKLSGGSGNGVPGNGGDSKTGKPDIWLPESTKQKSNKIPEVPNSPETPTLPNKKQGLFSKLTSKVVPFLSSVGTKLGSGAATSTGTAIAGGAGILGGIGAIAGVGSAVGNFYKALKTNSKGEKRQELYRGGTKLGMVGAGALTGAAIGSVVPVVGTALGGIVGAGIGGIGAVFGGNKLGDWLRKRQNKNDEKQTGTYLDSQRGGGKADSKLEGSNKKLASATDKSTKENKKYGKQSSSTAKVVKSYGAATSGAGTKVSGLGNKSGTAGSQVGGLGSSALSTASSMTVLEASMRTVASTMNSAAVQISSAAAKAGKSGGGSGSKVYGPTKKNAKGGYIGSHIVSELGEEGPEMVIPLTKHRSRALSLWSQAGKALGVRQHAKGGLVGTIPKPITNNRPSVQNQSGRGDVRIDVGGIRIEVNVSGSGNTGNDIVSAIRAKQNEIADVIMGAIADVCGTSYKNRTAEGM